MPAATAVLPRGSRLRSGTEIVAVSRRGAHARVADLSVVLAPSPDRRPADVSRAAVVVGRRAGGAVARNRQRRRLQHAVAELLPTLPAGTRVVVRGGAAVSSLSAAQLRSDLARAVTRALERSR